MIEPVSNEAAAELLRKFGQKTESEKNTESKNGAAFDVSKYLQDHGVETVKVEQKEAGTYYCLKHCVFDQSHKNNDAAIIQAPSGMLLYKCFHDSCQGKTWKDARKIISGDDPLYGAAKAGSQGEDISVQDAIDNIKIITSVTAKPAPIEYVFTVNGHGEFEKGAVGSIAATGGTGKSMLSIHLAVSMATGVPFGPFVPNKINRVMILNSEDTERAAKNRIYKITNGKEIDNFFYVNARGVFGPLMQMEKDMPIITEWMRGLSRLVEKYRIDFLFIDPFSRFCDMPEMGSGTPWVRELEKVALDSGITICSLHHTNEYSQQHGLLNKTMLRGHSSWTDGYRFNYGIQKVSCSDKLRRLDAVDRRVIEFKGTKINDGMESESPIYFIKNDSDGTLEYAEIDARTNARYAEALVDAIDETGLELSRRELLKEKKGKAVSDYIENRHSDFTRRRDMDFVIDYCLKKGWLIEAEVEAGKTTKTVIMRDNGGHEQRRTTTDNYACPPLSAYNDSELTVDTKNDGQTILSTDKPNDSNMITVDKIPPLKGEERFCPPFHPTGILGQPEDCLECTARHDRGEKKYCIEHVDHDSRMKSDTPCDQARPICRGPHRS